MDLPITWNSHDNSSDISLLFARKVTAIMRYLPKSPADREDMLREIGARSIDDLFAAIPAEYRLKRDLNVPRAYAESEIVEFFRERAAESS